MEGDQRAASSLLHMFTARGVLRSGISVVKKIVAAHAPEY